MPIIHLFLEHPACKIIAHHTSNQSFVTSLLPHDQLAMAALLYVEKLVKEMMLSISVQGEALLIQIKEAVCNNYEKLEAFAEILCKFTATAEIGNAITKEYSKHNCSIEM